MFKIIPLALLAIINIGCLHLNKETVEIKNQQQQKNYSDQVFRCYVIAENESVRWRIAGIAGATVAVGSVVFMEPNEGGIVTLLTSASFGVGSLIAASVYETEAQSLLISSKKLDEMEITNPVSFEVCKY